MLRLLLLEKRIRLMILFDLLLLSAMGRQRTGRLMFLLPLLQRHVVCAVHVFCEVRVSPPLLLLLLHGQCESVRRHRAERQADADRSVMREARRRMNGHRFVQTGRASVWRRCHRRRQLLRRRSGEKGGVGQKKVGRGTFDERRAGNHQRTVRLVEPQLR
jgi:hypothetical protein